ncbi:ADP-ribosylglycohydrolase family protein [Notoacmeibacter sp. MSK16QG-6]|uniref:ADP-ribosylglycohydrolase family protein n=1 Tax=Notoacmeibacter sp. MSK16QG-6 TaxID=2957982 RepID=UPI00209F4684|nr:ADP-ribosylglycohydrolase family protein [Notoacmeibacter sp. MSK16QG-6]MCP1200460.1 ADP-ribosylglycohydrolase family protein [Notoacmeibacter sp. MSK16QG-6]
MSASHENNAALRGRVRALLYGIAYGDALGGPVEKLSAAEIAETYGRVESVHHRWHRLDEDAVLRNGRTRGNGIITDDTLMTLCLMEIYCDLKRHIDAWDMAGPFVRKIAWEPRWIPELERETLLIERLFYPEKWIFHRLQLAACDPRQGGIGNMVNCGAAMYAAPIGVVNACDPAAAYQEAIGFMMGHQQSYGLEAAGVFAACVAEAFRPGATIGDIVSTATELAKDGTRRAIAEVCAVAERYRGEEWDYFEVVDAFHKTLLPFSPMGDDVRHGPEKSGVATAAYQPSRLLSIEELPIALGFCLLNEGAFQKTVQDCINSGRDTDSIGVMSGAILGALHGEDVLDHSVLTHVDATNKTTLLSAADAFAECASEIIHADLKRDEERRTRLDQLLTAERQPVMDHTE